MVPQGVGDRRERIDTVFLQSKSVGRSLRKSKRDSGCIGYMQKGTSWRIACVDSRQGKGLSRRAERAQVSLGREGVAASPGS